MLSIDGPPRAPARGLPASTSTRPSSATRSRSPRRRGAPADARPAGPRRLRRLRRQPARADQPRPGGARARAAPRAATTSLPQDLQALAKDALRHRLVLSYQALAEQVDAPTRSSTRSSPRSRCRASTSRRATSAREAGIDARLRRSADRTPAQPGPGPMPEALLRALDLVDRPPRRRPARRRLPLGPARRRHRARAGPPVRAGRRRPPDRLERHRAHARAARPRRSSPSACWSPGSSSTPRRRWLRHRRPAQGGRRRRRRARARPRRDPARQPPRRRHVRRGGGRHRCRRGQGRAGLLGLLTALREADKASRAGPRPAIGEALGRAGALARQRRARDVVVSDFRGAERDWRGPLLRARCAATTCWRSRSATRASRSCPTSASCWLVDPETGRQAARRHAEPAPPRARSPRRRPPRRNGAASPTTLASTRRRATSCSRPRATGSGTLVPFLRSGGDRRVTFEWPIALAAARARAAGRLGYSLLDRRRRRQGRRRSATPGAAAEHGPRAPRPAPAPAGRGCAARSAALLIGFARPHATLAVPLEEATVVLAIDVSRSMTATDVAADAPGRGRAGGRAHVPRGRCPRSSASASSRSPPARRRARRRPTTARPLAGPLPGAPAGRGNGDRRGDPARRSRSPGRCRAENEGTRPRPRRSCCSRTAHRRRATSPRQARPRRRATPGIPIYTIVLGTDEGVVERELEGGAPSASRCRRIRQTLRSVAATTDGEFFTARDDERLKRVYEELGSRLGHRDEETEVTVAFAGAGIALLLVAGRCRCCSSGGCREARARACSPFRRWSPLDGRRRAGATDECERPRRLHQRPRAVGRPCRAAPAGGSAVVDYQLTCPRGAIVGGLDAVLGDPRST